MLPSVISPEMLLPELLHVHPQARAVFDRYGLSGCGGANGPVESIRFFARAHGVDESQLLHELRQTISGKTPSAPPPDVSAEPSLADTIYRRYFIAGILVVLTAGASWGAWILWQIGLHGTFTGAASVLDINAHGHAQIFGWMGLFIMGFACQAFPRIWHTRLAYPRFAAWMFIAMLAGVIVRTIGMGLAGRWGEALPLALAGGGLEIAASLAFLWQIVATFRSSKAKLEPYVGFVLAALFWFVAMTLMSVWHTYTTMSAITREQLLWYVATYQAPLRDIQIHGLGVMIILGVSLRMLPGLFDVQPTPPRRAWWALAMLNAAVVGEVSLFIAYRWSGIHWLAAILMLPWLLIVASVVMVAWPWKLWRPFKEKDRIGKFVRMAYAWLIVSLAMLLMLPVYQNYYVHHMGSAVGFSHAYYGAIRHAITVGFISLMIMGFAAKVVPTLNGLDSRKLSPLWGPFLLVNLGCLLRVSLQTLTDWSPRFYPVIGISGTLEVVGLAWWGGGLLRIMCRGQHQSEESETQLMLMMVPLRIEPSHRVSDVLAWFPATEPVFMHHGFTMLKSPLMRRTVARGVTIAQAAAFRGVGLERLLDSLNAAIHAQVGPEPFSLRPSFPAARPSGL